VPGKTAGPPEGPNLSFRQRKIADHW